MQLYCRNSSPSVLCERLAPSEADRKKGNCGFHCADPIAEAAVAEARQRAIGQAWKKVEKATADGMAP